MPSVWGDSCCQGPPGRFGREAQLQGFAPPTSPLRLLAVADSETPYPSMGFVPLQGPVSLASRLSREIAFRKKQPSSEQRRKRCSSGVRSIPSKVRLERRGGKPL